MKEKLKLEKTGRRLTDDPTDLVFRDEDTIFQFHNPPKDWDLPVTLMVEGECKHLEWFNDEYYLSRKEVKKLWNYLGKILGD